ncbi:MAG TPA: GMC oxidoreductase [Solirubrobacteraceae bacterium]|nr:GMC oxidoreductase [Solirubrobacteraceae bacterium]
MVGSGPAGAATASALAGAGRRVVVIDPGLTLEPAREAARQRMASTSPPEWRPEDLALTSFSAGDERASNYKQLFGSDVAFRDDGVLPLELSEDVGARPSYASGGLSNVWGSGLLPYTEEDLLGWPLSAADLAAGYRAVLELLPFAGEDDELARRYPLFIPPDGPLLRTRAGEELLGRLRRHATVLGGSGYVFGAPRLAVRVGHPAPANGCVYCGHCLDGCPYGHIYNAAQTVSELNRGGAIEYRPGLHVDRLRETDGGVSIEATSVADGTGVHLQAERAFLAAGAISSTIILQRSGLLPQRCEILDSQALYLPFAWIGRVGQTGREAGHTLAQVTMVLDDPGVAGNPVHLTFYTYSGGVAERARSAHPLISRVLGPALEGLTRRLLVAICFFHSDDSDSVVSLWDASSGSVRLDPVSNPGRAQVIRRFTRALARSLAPLGIVPLAPFAEQAPVGGGYHYGGSAPMHGHAGLGQTDTLGRPAGCGRIHVVDSSCFPSVPGGAITLTAMANAHRIASAAASGEQS